ncbi:MAG: 2-hydroxyacid dehydrogenase [Thalassobaculum sp.]|uniref:2-hydroxyacid dehydrogenase n=1 Tax=Thalassobaculum sp. TaxID=2022740 RepID=UPI0032EE1B02
MSKGTVLVVTPVPRDLRDALAADWELRDHRRGDDGGWPPVPGIRVALTTSMAGADAALMDALPDLKLIACQGAGLDRIDLAAAAARGIAVANTPDVVTEDTADFGIALIYATARNVVRADRFVRDGRWASERMALSHRVAGKTVGIVGLGQIGSRLARKATGLEMTVLYTGPRAKPDAPYEYVADVADLAARVDFLVMTCPGGPATEKLVDARVLAALGPTGILINIARGSVVDEPALIAALGNGTIAGAGLDVFASEPAFDPAFLTFDNVVLQPHYATLTVETRRAIIGLLRDAIAGVPGG